MRMNGDEDMMATSGASASASSQQFYGSSVSTGSAAPAAATFPSSSISMSGSSISSSSRHIKGWEERTSRQHLQEALDKDSGSDNVSNHKTLGLVNRKGLGMELVASPVLLAKHSEWSGFAGSGSGGGAVWEENVSEKNEVDGSTTRSISNSFVVETGPVDHASELASNTASSRSLNMRDNNCIITLSLSDISNHSRPSTSMHYTLLPNTNGEVEFTTHGKSQVGQYDVTPTRAQPTSMAAVGMIMMRGHSNESPKGVEEFSLARYLEGQEADCATCVSEGGCKEEDDKMNDAEANANKASEVKTSEEDTSGELLNTTIDSPKSIERKATLFLSALRRKRDSVSSKIQKAVVQQQTSSYTAADEENVVIDLEPKGIISQGGDQKGCANDTTEQDDTTFQPDQKENDTVGMDDITVQTDKKENNYARSSSFSTSVTGIDTVNVNNIEWDEHLLGKSEVLDDKDKEHVEMYPGGGEFVAAENAARGVGDVFEDPEAHDKLFPSCFNALCDTLAPPDANLLDGSKTAAIYSDSLLDRKESRVVDNSDIVEGGLDGTDEAVAPGAASDGEAAASPSSVTDVQFGESFIFGTDNDESSPNTSTSAADLSDERHTGAEELTLSEYLQLQSDGSTVVSNIDFNGSLPRNSLVVNDTEDMPNTAETKSIANGLLNALRRRKVGGAKFSNTQEVVGQGTSIDDATLTDSKPADDSGDVDVKVQEELSREEPMMDEVIHTEANRCSTLDNLFCNPCSDFNFSNADIVEKDSRTPKKKRIGRLRKRREAKRASKAIESNGSPQSNTKAVDKKNKEKRNSRSEKDQEDDEKLMEKETERETEKETNAKKDVKKERDNEKDKEMINEMDTVEEEDEGNPLIASWFGGDSSSAFNMVDKDFVVDVMDVANKAAIVVLRGVRDVLDTIDDQINGCLEDDNVDDEGDASYYERDNFEDDEDVSTDVFVLPEFKKSGTSEKAESEMLESGEKSTSPKKKFFSKFRSRKGGVSA